MDASLVRAYEETVYWVFAPHAYIALRVGERSEELDALLSVARVREWAFVTACNPHSQPLSPAENDQRMAELQSVLLERSPDLYQADTLSPWVGALAPAHASVWKGRWRIAGGERSAAPGSTGPVLRALEGRQSVAGQGNDLSRLLPSIGVGTRGDWPPEPSLLILGISEEDALQLARRFGQNAIVAGALGEPARLVWC